jgi:hypothetical protein
MEALDIPVGDPQRPRPLGRASAASLDQSQRSYLIQELLMRRPMRRQCQHGVARNLTYARQIRGDVAVERRRTFSEGHFLPL